MDAEYIDNLTYIERLTFIRVFCQLVRADGNVSPDEIEFLKTIAEKYGVESSVVIDIIKDYNIDFLQEAKNISSRRNALQLIKELCLLAHSDGEVADNELGIIIDVARAMNIEDEKIVAINKYVSDLLVLSKAGKILLEE